MEFERLLREENAPLYSGEAKLSKSFWDNKQFTSGYGTPAFKGEVIGEKDARKRAKGYFKRAEREAAQLVRSKTWKGLSKERKGVLSRMTYQMGAKGMAGFKKTLAAVEEGDFARASAEMMDSKWAKQSPTRAAREAKTMYGLEP